ncbi:hypothetical protein ACYOEI_36570, partial [Singulisphaera rosea]
AEPQRGLDHIGCGVNAKDLSVIGLQAGGPSASESEDEAADGRMGQAQGVGDPGGGWPCSQSRMRARRTGMDMGRDMSDLPVGVNSR